jgi:hypothetical protein
MMALWFSIVHTNGLQRSELRANLGRPNLSVATILPP